jgi:hypothetical protein
MIAKLYAAVLELRQFVKYYKDDQFFQYVCSTNQSGQGLHLYKYPIDKDGNSVGRPIFIYGKYNFLFETAALPAASMNIIWPTKIRWIGDSG